MKKLVWIIIVVLLLGFGYMNRAVLADGVQRVTYFSRCDAPTTFKIGKIDNRFSITEQEFRTHIEDAGSIWSTAAGKELFVYDPKGDITVSLEYDERQSLNTQINELDSKLDEKNKALEPQIEAYEQRVAAFKQKASQLNKEIEEWNGKGGAPMEVYEQLTSRQKELQQESRALQAQATELGQSTDDYNSEVKELSQTVNTYNQALKYKPEEGIYIQDQEGRRIVIYFYNTKDELVHTLAHELGHALSMDHLENPEAIMFSRTNNAVIPTEEDLSALTEACRKRSIVEIARERFMLVKERLQQLL